MMPSPRQSSGRSAWTLLAIAFAVPIALTGIYVWTTRAPEIVEEPILSNEGSANPIRERVRQTERVRTLTSEEKYAEALGEADGLVAFVETAYGPESAETAEALMLRADLQRVFDQSDAARASYREVVRLRGPGHWQTREAEVKLGDLDTLAGRPPADREQWRKAFALRCRAERLYDAGKYLDGVAAAQEALKLREELWTGTHAEVAESMYWLGLLSAQHGKTYRAAAALLERAQELIETTLGSQHPSYALCTQAQADLAADRGDYNAAASGYLDTLNVQTQSRGELTVEIARTKNRLGLLYQTWRVRGAPEECNRAWEIREYLLGVDHSDYAESLRTVALQALDAWAFDRAKQLFEKAYQIRSKALGTHHPSVGQDLVYLSRVCMEQRKFSEVRLYLRKALQSIRDSRGEQHPIYAECLLCWASLLSNEHDMPRSTLCFQQVIEIREQIGCHGHPEYPGALLQLAENVSMESTILHQPADYAYGERLFHQAIAFYEVDARTRSLPDYVLALSMLVEFYYWNNFQNKPLKEVEGICDKTWEVIQAQTPSRNYESHPYFRWYSNARARCLITRGQLAEAEREYEKALEIEARAINPRTTIYLHGDSRTAYYTVKLRGNKFSEAEAIIRECLDLEEKFVRQIIGGQAERGRLHGLHHYFLNLSCYFVAALGRSSDESPVNVAHLYQSTLNYRGLIGSQQAQDRVALSFPQMRSKVDDVRRARNKLAQRVFRGPGEGNRAAWLRSVDQLTDDKEDKEAELSRDCGSHFDGNRLFSVTTADVQRSLPQGTALLDFMEFEHLSRPPEGHGVMNRQFRMVCFVVRRDQTPILIPLGPSLEIEKAVRSWREAVKAHNDGQEDGDLNVLGQAVSQLVWKPLALSLRGTSVVLIAPDGPICALPFAALREAEGDAYLIERFQFGHVPSGRLIPELFRRSTEHRGGLVAIGNVDYRSVKLPAVWDLPSKVPDLPETTFETGRVRGLHRNQFPGAIEELLSRDQATKVALEAALQRQPCYIHFAGHGFFAGADTGKAARVAAASRSALDGVQARVENQAFTRNSLLLSGLVLACPSPADREPDPAAAILTAEEVGNFDLQRTELVVLSACETGLGTVAGGEGAMGLQRAFHTAGARNVMTSLWKVRDDATAVLMDEFYTNYWKGGLPKLESLQKAQLTLLRQPHRWGRLRGLSVKSKPSTEIKPLPEATPSGGGRAHPALWAAFVLSGDGR